MNYKRLEIYVGWTCNHRCTYCMEYENMEQAWKSRVSKTDILKTLIKYKKLGYNHVTLLGGEPFIQEVFLDALKIAKKLGYIILVTTNCTTLHIKGQAERFLPYIDELFLSVEAIDVDLQKQISRTNSHVHWDGVFENIEKYWDGKLLKANIVITKDNIGVLFELVSFLVKKGIGDIAISYPDINYGYYGKEYVLKRIAPSYAECMEAILPIVDFVIKKGINLKLPDFPFCVFPRQDIQKYIQLTDDYDFATRIKIDHKNQELDRGELEDFRKLPRKRRRVKKCEICQYNNKCWGPSYVYGLLYGLNEINPII